MKKLLINKLINITKERQTKRDPSHDFQHVLRVFNLAEEIGKSEGADMDILIPAALFHDVVVYQKNNPQSRNATDKSADFASKILNKFKEYPKSKIEKVVLCIKQCSFTKKIVPKLLESKILQDADRLDATGAISIMRTFSSGGQMNRAFYNPIDPFCENNQIVSGFGIELFYNRLLLVEKGMHTRFAKQIAKRRTKFLRKFLDELRLELEESKIA